MLIDVHSGYSVSLLLVGGKLQIAQSGSVIYYAPTTARSWANQLLQLVDIQPYSGESVTGGFRGGVISKYDTKTGAWSMTTRSGTYRITGVGPEGLRELAKKIKALCNEIEGKVDHRRKENKKP